MNLRDESSSCLFAPPIPLSCGDRPPHFHDRLPLTKSQCTLVDMARSVRERVIEEWRGYPESPLAPKLGSHVGDAVRKFLAKVGMISQLDEQVIAAAWHEIVGDFIANHSAPDRIQNGILHIRVTQTTVLFELERNCKGRILRNLQERFGKTVVRDLKFRIR